MPRSGPGRPPGTGFAFLAAYNTDRIGDMEMWPVGTWTIPNPFQAYIKAGS